MGAAAFSGWGDLLFYVAAAVLVPLAGLAALQIKAWSNRVEKDSEAEAQEIKKEVDQRLRQDLHLQTTVSTLSRELAELTARVDQMETVVEVKYPLALDTLQVFDSRYPGAVDIPRILRQDMQE